MKDEMILLAEEQPPDISAWIARQAAKRNNLLHRKEMEKYRDAEGLGVMDISAEEPVFALAGIP